jgi:hypothetical protein
LTAGGTTSGALQCTHGPGWLALATGAIVMEDLKAAAIIKSLAAGSSPADAATLQTPDVVRALFLAAEALATAHERTKAGIEARLVKHGRLDAEQAPAARIR